MPKWPGVILACVITGCLLVIGVPKWFSNYVAEGVLQTETRQGNVLIALNDELQVKKVLLLGCHAAGVFPTPYRAYWPTENSLGSF